MVILHVLDQTLPVEIASLTQRTCECGPIHLAFNVFDSELLHSLGLPFRAHSAPQLMRFVVHQLDHLGTRSFGTS